MDKNWITVRISGAIDEAMDPDLLIEDREGIAKIYANEIAQAADKELVGLRTEIERYVQWVNDLQAGTYITCVYCGHNYGPDDEVPTSMAEVLKEHVAQCPSHPMSALKEEAAQLKAQMALMMEALRPCASGDEWKETKALANSLFSPVAFARQVCSDLLDQFSAAPKVAWSGPVEVRLDAQGLPILVPLDVMQTLEQMDGQEHHVLILMGEQGQENEQEGANG